MPPKIVPKRNAHSTPKSMQTDNLGFHQTVSHLIYMTRESKAYVRIHHSQRRTPSFIDPSPFQNPKNRISSSPFVASFYQSRKESISCVCCFCLHQGLLERIKQVTTIEKKNLKQSEFVYAGRDLEAVLLSTTVKKKSETA